MWATITLWQPRGCEPSVEDDARIPAFRVDASGPAGSASCHVSLDCGGPSVAADDRAFGDGVVVRPDEPLGRIGSLGGVAVGDSRGTFGARSERSDPSRGARLVRRRCAGVTPVAGAGEGPGESGCVGLGSASFRGPSALSDRFDPSRSRGQKPGRVDDAPHDQRRPKRLRPVCRRPVPQQRLAGCEGINPAGVGFGRGTPDAGGDVVFAVVQGGEHRTVGARFRGHADRADADGPAPAGGVLWFEYHAGRLCRKSGPELHGHIGSVAESRLHQPGF